MSVKSVFCVGLATLGLMGCDGKKVESIPKSTVQLPEAYGVYLKYGGDLHRLDENKAGFINDGKRSNATESPSLIVYDRRLMMLPGKLENVVKLVSRRYVRCNVESLKSRKHDKPDEFFGIHLGRAGMFGHFGDPVTCRFIPVDGKPEMVELRPVENLKKGLYSVVLMEEFYPFGVGVTNAVGEREYALDCWYTRFTDKLIFPIGAWAGLSTPGNGWFNDVNATHKEDMSYRETEVLDRQDPDFDKRLSELLDKRLFVGAAWQMHNQAAIGKDISKWLEKTTEAMINEAQSQQKNHPEAALAYARRILAYRPSDSSARKIMDDTKHQVELKSNVVSTAIEDWEKQSKEPGEVISRFSYVAQPRRRAGEQDAMGEVALTRNHYVDTWANGSGGQNRKELPLDSIDRIEPFQEEKRYRGQPDETIVYYGFNLGGLRARFVKAEDRDKAMNDTQQAIRSYRKAASEVTGRPQSVRVSGDVIEYAIQLSNKYWVGPIDVPMNYLGYRFVQRNGSTIRYWLKQPHGTTEMSSVHDKNIELKEGDSVFIKPDYASDDGKVITFQLYLK